MESNGEGHQWGGQWGEGGKGKGGNAQTAAQRHARSDSGREERLMCRKTHCITYIVYDENVKKNPLLGKQNILVHRSDFFSASELISSLTAKSFPDGHCTT